MKKITGAQGAFIVRIIVEAMQSAKAAGKRLLEAGFTGQKKDKLGHTRYYQDGRQVKNPNAKEKANINAAAGKPLPAGQAPSHADAATRVNALHADAPPEHVAALANDLMNMSVEDLTKLAKAPAAAPKNEILKKHKADYKAATDAVEDADSIDKKRTARDNATKVIHALANEMGIDFFEASDLLEKENDEAGLTPGYAPPTPAETKSAATAEKATSSGKQSGIGEAGDLVKVDTSTIHVDPTRFQYKQKLDSTTGAGDNLKNVTKFNPLFAGVIHAWKDPANGKVYVVNGHHRMELAKRAGHEKMNVQMIEAPDAATARSTGALINMAEGRGTALDAAKFLRDSGQSIEDLKGHGVSLKEKVVDNAVQLKGLSSRIFNDLASGILDEDKAVAIGRHLKDHKEQEQLYNHYLEQREKNNKEFSASTLDQAAQDLARAPKKQGGGQMDLFGNTDDGKSLFLEKAELKNKIRSALTQEVNDYGVAGNARRAKNIAGAGNILQVDKNKELSKEADRIKQAFEQFQHLAGPLSDAINAHVEEYANVKGSKRAIVEKSLAAVRTAIQEIIDGGSQNNLRTSPADNENNQGAGGTGQADVPGDTRRGNAQDLGPSLFGEPQDEEPAAAAASKADEPGFTGTDAEGREWRNGELVAAKDEPAAPAAAADMGAETLALDALRLKGNRRPHNAGHITPDAVASLKKQGLIDSGNKITDKGREQLYAAKNKKLRKATGPIKPKADAPAPPTNLGADADALEALRLKTNKKPHIAGHITPAAVASLKKQGWIDDANKLTQAGRIHLNAEKAKPKQEPKPNPTTGGEKYFGTGGEHAVVNLKNGKKGIIPPPMANVPGWKDYEPIAPKSFYNLSESEAVEHREAQELIRKEWPKFRQDYLAKMGVFDPETGELISITLNCDDWRDQFPNYVGTNSGTIHDAASYANMRMLNEAMALMKGKGNNQFLVLGGGGGSGKGTATKDIIKAGDYPVVLDSVSDDSAWTKELMDMAKGHGYGGQFVFIDRAPQDAWKDGVVKRAMESREKFNAGDKTSLARTVPLSVAVPANLKARRAAFELIEDGQVPTMIINNNLGFGKAREVVGEEAAAYLQNGISSYNKDELLKELENDTYGLYEQGKIPDDVATGLISAKTIAARRLQSRSIGGSDREGPPDGRGTNTDSQGASNQAPLDGSTSQGSSSAGKSGEIETDYTRQQQIKNSLDEGELLLKYGKKTTGEKYSTAELNWILKSVNSDRAKLGQPGFTGIDAQGREWQNGELVSKQEEPKQKRAAAGGEMAPNGERYKGGAFIATTEMPKRLKDKIKTAAGDGMVKVTDPETGKTTRETPPSPNLMSISASMIGTLIGPRGDVNHAHLDYLNASYDLRTKINELASKYKAGEKWVPINDYPEVAKGNDIYRLADAGLPIHPDLLQRMPEEFKNYYTLQKSKADLKNDKAREDFDKIQIGDKFKDKTGKEYVIHKKGPGTIKAWLLVNGEPRVGNEKKFAITDSAKEFYPDHEKSVSLEDFAQAAPAPTPDEAPTKEPWEMNQAEAIAAMRKKAVKMHGEKWAADHLDRETISDFLGQTKRKHRYAVQDAIDAGKKVDPRVLADYPDIQAAAEPAAAPAPAAAAPDDAVARHMIRQGFTGVDSLGRQWQDGELVAAKDEPAAPAGNTDLFGNPTRQAAPKGPETMPGLFGEQVPIAPDAPAAAGGEQLPGSDNPLDRAGAGRGRQDATQDMFGLFGPATKNKIDQVNNGPDEADSTPPAENQSLPHEMNWSEYKQSRIEKLSPEQQAKWAEQDNRDFKVAAKSNVENQWGEEHKAFIKRAQDEGQAIPGEVYDDYPSLRPGSAAEPAPEPSTPAATAEPTTNKAPGVNRSDVPYALAYAAHSGTSFVPDKRASQRQADYVNQMQADWEHLSQFAKTPEQKEVLKSEFARYKAGYLTKYKAALQADSRTLSAMVTGPARFPTRRNNKANDVADKRRQETDEFRKKALFAAAKAINPVTSGAPVLSRDADAVKTLQTQLDQLTQSQELMKKMNAAYKKFLKKPDSLAASGLTEKQQALIKDFQANPPERAWSKLPFPPYKLQNQGANIRRIQDRIETLSKLKAMPEKEEKYTGGVSISHDPDDARIRVRFPGKPSPEVIKQIKSRGFIWSPTNGAWQRQLNGNGTYAADELMKTLGHEKITTEATMPTNEKAQKIKLVQAIIARKGIKPPQPKAQAKKTPEASGDADPRVKRIRELMDAYC
ncbi:hypothetical protein UFOVP822_5 [uncultured Caudovirales phage]|uniref:Uncharacterized protein n=1 Tax=uncultured Caudovirales phage TaxID=2100421 RepID=A0A6J5P4Y2_9CAUD|nr:hypothetical protein UFOVP822_5 [uncultured Caudovirales phage]